MVRAVALAGKIKHLVRLRFEKLINIAVLPSKMAIFFELHRFAELQRFFGHTSEEFSRENVFVIRFESGIMH